MRLLIALHARFSLHVLCIQQVSRNHQKFTATIQGSFRNFSKDRNAAILPQFTAVDHNFFEGGRTAIPHPPPPPPLGGVKCLGGVAIGGCTWAPPRWRVLEILCGWESNPPPPRPCLSPFPMWGRDSLRVGWCGRHQKNYFAIFALWQQVGQGAGWVPSLGGLNCQFL